MSNADKQIADILKRYDEDFASNTWVVPGGKQRAIYHKCIERLVAKASIFFEPPVVVSTEPDNIAIVVTGRMPDGRREWSFGEASPKNNKNAYGWSMAEKRGKDRVALKLIGLHGLVYSEEEADDFKQSAAPQEDSDAKIADNLIAKLKRCKTENELDNLTKNDDFRRSYKDLPQQHKNRTLAAIYEQRETLKPNVLMAG